MSSSMWQRALGKWFIDHPVSVNETYAQHFVKALRFAFKLFHAGTACLIHALIPGCCVTTGSKAIKDLHDQMITFRVKGTKNDTADAVIEYMI